MKWSMKNRGQKPLPLVFFCRSTSWDQQSSCEFRGIWMYTQRYLQQSHQSESMWQFWHCEQAFELIGWTRASRQNDWHEPLALELNVWAWNSQLRSIQALWAHSHPRAYRWRAWWVHMHWNVFTCALYSTVLYLWSSPQKLTHYIIYYVLLYSTLIVMFLLAAQVWVVCGLQINVKLFKPIDAPIEKKFQ